jgi:hypothetical protein
MPMLQGVSISDSKNPNSLNAGQRKLIAIVDTGADMCAIDDEIANQLSLVAIRQSDERGGYGGRMTNVYDLRIILPNENLNGETHFQVETLSAPLKAQGFLCDFVLGEDVIQHFELHLNRSLDEWTLTKDD